MKSSICVICENNFSQEVINERRPLLLLCIGKDDNYKNQLELTERMSILYGDLLKFGRLEESFLAAFKKKYKVIGTPTYLILLKGEERNRFLGLTDEKDLTDFILSSLK